MKRTESAGCCRLELSGAVRWRGAVESGLCYLLSLAPMTRVAIVWFIGGRPVHHHGRDLMDLPCDALCRIR